jgi:uncharacterized protein YecE (DUF72 family)
MSACKCPPVIAREPRHPSGFTRAVDGELADLAIACVAADPRPVAGAGSPGGWGGLAYCRMHGAPRIYFSEHDAAALAARADRWNALAPAGVNQ